MIQLFTTYYYDKDPDRQAEYLQVIKNNINNTDLDRIFFLLEPETELPFEHNKVNVIHTSGRPSFSNFIEAINNNTQEEDFNVVANTDIYFDASLCKIKEYSFEHQAMALNRWDVLEKGDLSFFNKYYSTDTWVFKGQVKNIDAPYYIGQQGCDNRFNYDLVKNGYQLINPSYSIRTLHLHVSQVRSYVSSPTKYDAVKKPYLYILPAMQSSWWGVVSDVGIKKACKILFLYRHIRYDFYKKIKHGQFEEGEELQGKTSKFKSSLLCLWYFNYLRFNISSITFKM